jgi:hypothetical protein
VSAALGEVSVTWDPGHATLEAIAAAVRGACYEVPDGQPAVPPRDRAGTRFLPGVTQSMGYGMIFVVGLLTSLHCVAMCGGIVLSQGVSCAEPARAPGRGSEFVITLPAAHA